MSGPKGGSWSLARQEEEQRRREHERQVRQLRARLAETATQAAEVRVLCEAAREAHGSVISLPARGELDIREPGDDLGALTSAASSASAAVARVRTRLERELADVRAARLREALGGGDDGPVAEVDLEAHRRRVGSSAGPPAPDPAAARAALHARVERLIGRLRAVGADRADVERVEAEAARLAAADDITEASVYGLQRLVDRANANTDERNRRVEEFAGLREQLAQLDAAAGAALERAAARAGEPPTAADIARARQLVAAARTAAEAAERDAERRRAAEILRASFESLGYAVEEDFVTALTERDVAHAKAADAGAYAVEVRFEQRHGGLRLRAVSDEAAAASADADLAAEDRFCATVDPLRAELDRRGMALRIDQAFDPGRVAVGRAPLSRLRFAGGATPVRRPQERTL